MPFTRGRPRTANRRERVTIEIDDALYAAVLQTAEGLADNLTLRGIVEAGLRLWLEAHGVPLPSATPEEPTP